MHVHGPHTTTHARAATDGRPARMHNMQERTRPPAHQLPVTPHARQRRQRRGLQLPLPLVALECACTLASSPACTASVRCCPTSSVAAAVQRFLLLFCWLEDLRRRTGQQAQRHGRSSSTRGKTSTPAPGMDCATVLTAGCFPSTTHTPTQPHTPRHSHTRSKHAPGRST